MKRTKQILEKALLEGGNILADAMKKPKKIRYKGRANLVTETDKLAERRIVEIIRNTFSHDAILAEETATEVMVSKNNRRWIIDPVDGTTNFAHGLPVAAVSIAFEEYGCVTMGGVLNPFSREFFWAEKGKGAFLNAKPIRVSGTSKLKDSLLVTGFPYDRTKYAHRYLKIVEKFMQITHGIRRLGSASLDLCFVACGRFDGYWESKLMPWDQAAGYLILKEAGGRVTGFRGEPFSVYDKAILATNGRIHGEMVGVLSNFL